MARGKKTGGREVGTPNKITTDLRRKINGFIENNWEKVQKDFDKLEPKDRLLWLEKILSYSLPRLQSVEYTSDTDAIIDKLSDSQLEELMEKINKNLQDI